MWLAVNHFNVVVDTEENLQIREAACRMIQIKSQVSDSRNNGHKTNRCGVAVDYLYNIGYSIFTPNYLV